MKTVTLALLFLVMWEIFVNHERRSLVTSYVIIFLASVLASLHMIVGPAFLGFVWWFNSVLWAFTLQLKKKSITMDVKIKKDLKEIDRLSSETRRQQREIRDLFRRLKDDLKDEEYDE
jgi:hypothetical protein